MGKGSNQKLKILYLSRILLEKTDETHKMTMADILAALKVYGIEAERKSIYNDIENLILYGMDIIKVQEENTCNYYVGSRQFELAELKLLVDAVQSSKFITEKKSTELIKKIEGLASSHDALKLQRQVYVAGRIKTMNESIYYNVDSIHAAIVDNDQITFQYYQWNVNKEMEPRHDGALYEMSPWALTWDDENYYLVAYDGKEGMIKHFRVDKMKNIKSLRKRREGEKTFRQADMAIYTKKMFGMYDGQEENVKLECENGFAGVMIDRFGKDISMLKSDEEHFIATVKVAVSKQFLGWVIALGEGVTIIGPERVVDQVKEEIKRMLRQYTDA